MSIELSEGKGHTAGGEAQATGNGASCGLAQP